MQGAEEIESLAEEARALMSDKDALNNCMQSTHDTHTSKLDAVEDALLNQEATRAAGLVASHTEWAHARNRDRIVEIIGFSERNTKELADLLSGRDDDEEGG
jgi:hypothetical protein